ncbi:hypothetical protein AGMMS49950_06510 [Endomicrobiia bacterium]|nr:hypothetical protein AGMMS49950_06510 [Endomicrobiia bacterium]
MKKSLFLLLSLALVNSSCATIFRGTTERVAINSSTQGANIYVDGGFVGSDSVNVKLKRNRDHAVAVKKDGFQTERGIITSDLQTGWLIVSILFGWGIIVDVATGALFRLSPDNIRVDLEPEQKK